MAERSREATVPVWPAGWTQSQRAEAHTLQHLGPARSPGSLDKVNGTGRAIWPFTQRPSRTQFGPFPPGIYTQAGYPTPSYSTCHTGTPYCHLSRLTIQLYCEKTNTDPEKLPSTHHCTLGETWRFRAVASVGAWRTWPGRARQWSPRSEML